MLIPDRDEYRHKLYLIQCLFCGNHFYGIQGRQFCNRECSNKSRRKSKYVRVGTDEYYVRDIIGATTEEMEKILNK